MDAYEKLAGAVVLQACSDYLWAKRSLLAFEQSDIFEISDDEACLLLGNKVRAEKLLADCVSFFKKEIGLYTTADGEKIMERLDKKVTDLSFKINLQF